MIELRVYASLLSRRAQTFLLTVRSVSNCRDFRLLEKLPEAEFSLRRASKHDYKNIEWKVFEKIDSRAYEKIGLKLNETDIFDVYFRTD